jgi:hypothetical protein
MNCAHAINVNTQPYSNARRPVVMSNRPNFERFSGSTAPYQQRKGFTSLHSNDRKIYDTLLDIVEAQPGTYTVGEVRSKIDGMLNGKMHASMRVKLEQLISNLSRTTLSDMVEDYEDLLCRIAPAIMPNESKADYAARTNLPEFVVDETFKRGDTEAF